MRYFRIRLTPSEGGFHPVDDETARHPELERKAILHLNRLNDGSGVALFLMGGDPAEMVAIYEDHPEKILSYDIFDSDEEGFYSHVHFTPGSPAAELLDIIDRHKLMIDPPLEFAEDGGLRVTAAGPEGLVREAAIDVPDSVDTHLELIGEYDPDRDSLVGILTERQQEVLRTAIEMRYYSLPREATHEDLAGHLDCSAGTVGEHLRKIEARILSELML